jgi:hypothetical protein
VYGLHFKCVASVYLQPLDQPPARKVATMGPWPAPLTIAEDVDDMPNSDVPRGFVCPITQAIMRQPALLLHDATVTPSTYDKEAISQWLAEHRCGHGRGCWRSCRPAECGGADRAVRWLCAWLFGQTDRI